MAAFLVILNFTLDAQCESRFLKKRLICAELCKMILYKGFKISLICNKIVLVLQARLKPYIIKTYA